MTEEEKNSHKYKMLGLRIVGDFSASIAVPVVLAAILGQYLDEKYDKYPLFIFICLIISFVTTAKIIVNKTKRYGKEYKDLNKFKKIKK